MQFVTTIVIAAQKTFTELVTVNGNVTVEGTIDEIDISSETVSLTGEQEIHGIMVFSL